MDNVSWGFVLSVFFAVAMSCWIAMVRMESRHKRDTADTIKKHNLAYAEVLGERDAVVLEYNRLCGQYRELGQAMENVMAYAKQLERRQPAEVEPTPLARDRKFWRSMVQMSHPDKAVSLDVARTMLNRVCQMAAKELK